MDKVKLEDIAAIQRSISTFENNKESHIVESGYKAQLVMQKTILALALTLLAAEFFSRGALTQLMLTKNSVLEWRALGVVAIFLLLALSIFVGQIMVRRAARQIGEEANTYIKRQLLIRLNTLTVFSA